MAYLAKLAAVALMIASGAVAAPWDPVIRHTTHRARAVGPNKVQINAYQPESTFETYGTAGVDHPLSKRATKASPEEAAKAFLASKLGVDSAGLVRKTGHSTDAVSNEYFSQQFNGVPVANAVANVAMKDGKVVSFGASFVKPRSVASPTASFPKQNAIAKAESTTGAKYNSIATGLEYFAKDTDHVVLTHTIQVQNESTGEWYLVYVDAASGEVVNLVDFVADASYRVIPFTSRDLTTGFSTITDPADSVSSPNGWHQYGTTKTTTTSGNNVIAYKNFPSGTTSQSSAGNNYIYTQNPAKAPDVGHNVDAARVNAFYVANMVHDLTYRYGFTETSHNFQQDNHGLGGVEDDRVEISVQDPAYSDNADFATLPDGQPGRMRMFLWDLTSPERDGALENDIVVHEYGHGVSNRLTGGGTATCLQTTEARGLGEGWSDALADWTERTSATDRDFTIGKYVHKKNLRSYPYSTSKKTNPLTYSSLRTLDKVHAIGEVWALIWHEIYAALIAVHGFTATKNDPTLTAGNTVALHLFLDAFSLQPCNPTFITARAAIIQADANCYAGANACTLWKAFAKRGLGYGATTAKTDSHTLPPGCK